MLLYRVAPKGFWAAADPESPERLRILYSDPFETLPGGWEFGRDVDRATAAFLNPVRPSKIVAIGRNYAEHARELGNALPEEPLFFLKAPSALIGPGAPIVLPPESQRVEHEGEIAVVLRHRLTRASAAEARDAVLGVTCANDVTARDLQKKDGQWTRAKGMDTFCPVGPLVPRSEVPDPHALGIRAIVSGETLQDSSTANLIFGIDEIISYASRTSTLEAGDLILTGTPAGVGVFRDPKRLLQPGDTVTIQIDGVGEITNPVIAG